MHINILELADNQIQAEGAKYLLEMMRANFTIRHLVWWNLNSPLDGAEGLQVMYSRWLFACRICPVTI